MGLVRDFAMSALEFHDFHDCYDGNDLMMRRWLIGVLGLWHGYIEGYRSIEVFRSLCRLLRRSLC